MHPPDMAETGTVTFLAIGVAGLLGTVAMLRLRRLPAARGLANGNR